MIKRIIIQIEKKMKLNKHILHNKMNDFAIEMQNLDVITRNNKLRRFHEVIRHIKILKFVLDFDTFK